MQTLTTPEKNKSTSAGASYKNKQQPFFSPVKVQPKLTIGAVDDPYEQQADAMADRVMRMPAQRNENSFFKPLSTSSIQRKNTNSGEEENLQRKTNPGESTLIASSVINETINSGGKSLDKATLSFMEPRFSADFSKVKIHNNNLAAKSADSINAIAYTLGNNVVFNSGKYNTTSDSGKRLLAHELTHVVQQGNQSSPGTVQRTVELRPPGRGEASAFDRRQEIVDRLNSLSSAVNYTLNDRVLQYKLIEGATLTYFDRQMISFIDIASVLPLRLITSSGLVGSRSTGFSSLLIDSFMSGYLDLEDMMRSDDNSFQMNLLHILTERSRARNYARRIGTAGLSPIDATGAETPEFRRAHQAGIDSENAYLRDIFSDPTIRFMGENLSGDNLIFTFRSAEKYRIIHTFRRQSQNLSGGTVVVRNAAGNTVSVTDFIAQRQAAAEVVVDAP